MATVSFGNLHGNETRPPMATVDSLADDAEAELAKLLRPLVDATPEERAEWVFAQLLGLQLVEPHAVATMQK